MTCSLRLETLNIWGGRLYHPLLEHIRRQAGNVDIFCFQEVYSTHSDRLSTRHAWIPAPLRLPTHDMPERPNIYQELLHVLPYFFGYFSSCQDCYAYHCPVHFDLSYDLPLVSQLTPH